MAAPKEIKEELLRLLDEAYDADSIAVARVTVPSASFLFYGEPGEPEPDTYPSEMLYKIVVDATDNARIAITIRPRLEPIVWPD